jgi:hypothetical protein
MDKVGKLLNLKKHTVGRQRVPIIGPGDIEGHLGRDHRYYMLDYARLMPPEEPPIGYRGCPQFFLPPRNDSWIVQSSHGDSLRHRTHTRTRRQEEMGDRSVFFKMLRPEIVHKYHSPLSSDAFTGKQRARTNAHACASVYCDSHARVRERV